DRYQRQVVSLAVLGDERPGWRPDAFGYARWARGSVSRLSSCWITPHNLTVVATYQRDTLFSERASCPLFPRPFCVPEPSQQVCPRQSATVTQVAPAREHLSPDLRSPHRTATQGRQPLPPTLCPTWSRST